jgi:hypothetical protein
MVFCNTGQQNTAFIKVVDDACYCTVDLQYIMRIRQKIGKFERENRSTSTKMRGSGAEVHRPAGFGTFSIRTSLLSNSVLALSLDPRVTYSHHNGIR